LSLERVPCVHVDHLSPDEQRVLRLAVNRLAEKGQWDLEALKIEFEELILLDAPIEISRFAVAHRAYLKGQLSSGASAVRGMSHKETGPETGRESTVLLTLFYQFSRPSIEAVSVITTSGLRKCCACRRSSSEAICACI
jgi:hypothetical protein